MSSLHVYADGVGDVLESVAAQQLGQTALQHGDLLRASVHQRADEHDQAGAESSHRLARG